MSIFILWIKLIQRNVSRCHEGLMFPKLAERFRMIRKVSESFDDFDNLHRIWDQKYHITDKRIPKMTSLDRIHTQKLHNQANDRRNFRKLSECFEKFRKP